jgi:hypothetical protein
MRYALILWVGLLFCCAGNQRLKKTQCESPCSGTVVVFIGIDCPISQSYVARLNRIFSDSRDSLQWTGYVPQEVPASDIRKFIDEYKVDFPLQKDKNLNKAKLLNASVTPEVFVLDKTGSIFYRGAIDNWFYALGKHRQSTTEFYLQDGIRALLNGREPPVSEVHALGCLIQIKKPR